MIASLLMNIYFILEALRVPVFALVSFDHRWNGNKCSSQLFVFNQIQRKPLKYKAAKPTMEEANQTKQTFVHKFTL